MNKESEFISQLTKKTLRSEIKWEEISKKGILLPDEEKVVSKIYMTTVNEKMLRIYKFQYKHYVDYDESIWNERYRLEMIDDNYEQIYEFGYDYSLSDLFNALTKMNAGIDDFLDGFLNSKN